MRKLCLAVFSLWLCTQNAYADRKGHFVRIECNRDLGLLEIGVNTIWGALIGNYFSPQKSVYKYSIDMDDKDKSKAEMILVNGWSKNALPFAYHCQLSEKLSYNIQIEAGGEDICELETQDVSYLISIVEHHDKDKILFERISFGCGSFLKGVQLTAEDDYTGSDITFIGYGKDAFFMSEDIIEGGIKIPLTEDTIWAQQHDQTSSTNDENGKSLNFNQ